MQQQLSMCACQGVLAIAVALAWSSSSPGAAAIAVPVSGADCNIGVWDDRAGSCVCPSLSACMAVVVEPRKGDRPFRTSCGAGQHLEYDL